MMLRSTQVIWIALERIILLQKKRKSEVSDVLNRLTATVEQVWKNKIEERTEGQEENKRVKKLARLEQVLRMKKEHTGIDCDVDEFLEKEVTAVLNELKNSRSAILSADAIQSGANSYL